VTARNGPRATSPEARSKTRHPPRPRSHAQDTGVLDQARAYAARGWPVFPVEPGGKRPLTRNGFTDASTDPELVALWWRLWPGAGVATATGAPSIDVLDIDLGGWPGLGRLRDAGLLSGWAAQVRTPSGGLHVWFNGTGNRSGSLPRSHIDYRAAGGYVLMPPTRVRGRAYRLDVPGPGGGTFDWAAAVALLDPGRARRAVPRGGAVSWDGGELPPAVRRALDSPCDDRSAALFRLVAAMRAAGMDKNHIHSIAGGYSPAVEKYGARLAAEVDRCLSRMGGPHE
jgi:hypothetical protein